MPVFITGGSGLTTARPSLLNSSPPVTPSPMLIAARTRALFGWAPAHLTLLEDMEFGDYFAAQPA